ncbi:hypothetical protein [Streptomyces sp. NPDC001635]
MSTDVTPVHERVARPSPLGLMRASETALFIAAPLLSAGSLSLIGVVCADADEFRLAGPTLLLLVTAVISLLLSIQLGYQARQWIYSYEDLQNWTGEQRPGPQFLERQRDDYKKGRKRLYWAGIAYNLGTVLLAFGVASVLAPGGSGGLAVWRWAATVLVMIAAVGEVIWTFSIYVPRRYWSFRRKQLDTQESLMEMEHRDV